MAFWGMEVAVLGLNSLGALSIERVVDDKLPCQDLVVAQAKRTEAVRDPAQTFAGWVGVRRM
jgi:hypothetical protein